MNCPPQLKYGGFALALIMCLAAPRVSCEQKEGRRQLERKSPSGGARESYERRHADGLRVTVYQVREKKLISVHPGQSFTNGDEIKIKFESNFDGYIYVINLTPGGESRLLFPKLSSRHNAVRAGQDHLIPTQGEFRFDEEPGLEVLQIVMSQSQVYFLEAFLDRAIPRNGNLSLDRSALQSLRALTGRFLRFKGSGIATQTRARRSGGLQSRALTLESRKEGSTLILSGVDGTTRFSPGEVSIFEIRLNHH